MQLRVTQGTPQCNDDHLPPDVQSNFYIPQSDCQIFPDLYDGMKHWCEPGPRRLWLMQNLFQMQIGVPPSASGQPRHGKLLQRVKRLENQHLFLPPTSINVQLCLLNVLWMARVLTWCQVQKLLKTLTRSWGMKCLAIANSKWLNVIHSNQSRL